MPLDYTNNLFITFDLELIDDATKDDAIWNRLLKTFPYRYKLKVFERETSTRKIIYADIMVPISEELYYGPFSIYNITPKFVDIIMTEELRESNINWSFSSHAQLFASSIKKIIGDEPTFKTLQHLKTTRFKVHKIFKTKDIKIIYGDGSINKKTNQASYAIAVLKQTEFSPLAEEYQNNLVKHESFTGANCIADVQTGVIDNATSNIGELNALHKAITVGITSSEPVICINCDSEYAIRSMREYIYNWNKNGYRTSDNKEIKNIELIKSMYEDLVTLMHHKIVCIRWVHGHNNDYFNELCDVEAKKALGIL